MIFHPLPFLTYITENIFSSQSELTDSTVFLQVTQNLDNFSVLFALMRVARSIIQNPHIHIEPYVSVLSFSGVQLLMLHNHVELGQNSLFDFCLEVISVTFETIHCKRK